jgi:hypothetical protein
MTPRSGLSSAGPERWRSWLRTWARGRRNPSGLRPYPSLASHRVSGRGCCLAVLNSRGRRKRFGIAHTRLDQCSRTIAFVLLAPRGGRLHRRDIALVGSAAGTAAVGLPPPPKRERRAAAVRTIASIAERRSGARALRRQSARPRLSPELRCRGRTRPAVRSGRSHPPSSRAS